MAETTYVVKKVQFHLLLTGKGEREFITQFLRSIVADQNNKWTEHGGQTVDFDENPEFIGQQSPRKQNVRELEMVGTHKKIPTKLEEKVSLKTRSWLLQDPDCFVLLIDDLESSRADMADAVFKNYRAALDKALDTPQLRTRAAVHFLVNMIEAYYFTHPDVVNDELGTNLQDPVGDVEEINHPKNALKSLVKATDSTKNFREVEDGARIVCRLDLERVLSNPKTCRSLRTLVGWCRHRLGAAFDHRWQLAQGEFHPLTQGQIPWP
ncbi:MAG TPA: DUF4276 family protein [Polyangium sp.]|nr:DUF4276 family protein [Polyangium sp.]